MVRLWFIIYYATFCLFLIPPLLPSFAIDFFCIILTPLFLSIYFLVFPLVVTLKTTLNISTRQFTLNILIFSSIQNSIPLHHCHAHIYCWASLVSFLSQLLYFHFQNYCLFFLYHFYYFIDNPLFSEASFSCFFFLSSLSIVLLNSFDKFKTICWKSSCRKSNAWAVLLFLLSCEWTGCSWFFHVPPNLLSLKLGVLNIKCSHFGTRFAVADAVVAVCCLVTFLHWFENCMLFFVCGYWHLFC